MMIEPFYWNDFMIEIYTDGSCLGNPGPGGAGVCVVNNQVAIDKLSFPSTMRVTNNIAEMVALFQGLKWLKANKAAVGNNPVRLVTDSNYCVKGMSEWRPGWERKKFKDLANVEYWKALFKLHDELGNPPIEWVKGHSKNRWNKIADTLAVEASNKAKQRGIK